MSFTIHLNLDHRPSEARAKEGCGTAVLGCEFSPRLAARTGLLRAARIWTVPPERRSPTRRFGIWNGRAGSETGAPLRAARRRSNSQARTPALHSLTDTLNRFQGGVIPIHFCSFFVRNRDSLRSNKCE